MTHQQERQASMVAALIRRGQAAARDGKKAEARCFFQTALETVPDHPDVLLWLAYLAGGGRPSLVYLVRLLESDPTDQRARKAIRWARKHAQSQTMPVVPPPLRPSRQGQRGFGMLVELIALLVIVVSGAATAAFALDPPQATPTRARLVAVVANPTPTESPSPTALSSPTSASTATPTATAPPPTPSPFPTATPTALPPTLTPSPTVVVSPTPFPTAPVGDTFRWIDVDLTQQRLVAYEGETPVRTVIVSTGTSRTPTVTGRFQIYVKYKAASMSGPGYSLANVPYVMYFYGGYGLHGTYWHSSFGQPMSHGCVNLPTPEAEWLYNWASVGTPVVVHY